MLTPGATRIPKPATPPTVWRRSPTKSPTALVRAAMPKASPQVRKRGASVLSDARPPPGLLRIALLKPVAGLPSRRRKLSLRSSRVAFTDMLELMSVRPGLGGTGVGTGTGVGIGVGTGVGVGVGIGVGV